MRPRAGSWCVLPSPKLQLARVAPRENVAAPKETNPRRRSDGRRETNARRKRRSNANPAPYPNADVASEFCLAIVRSFGSSAVMDTYPEGPEDVLFELSFLCRRMSRALAGSFARAGGFALGARKLHPARVTIKRTSRAAADEPARQKRRRSGGEAAHARRSFERRRRWSSLFIASSFYTPLKNHKKMITLP